MHIFLENVIFFRNVDPYRHYPAHVLHMVGTHMRAKFRHRTTQRLGGFRPRQNKQTLKYLVHDALIRNSEIVTPTDKML